MLAMVYLIVNRDYIDTNSNFIQYFEFGSFYFQYFDISSTE